MRAITWAIEPHICRSCGGRVLRGVSGVGMTPGGNPMFRCADCGAAKADMSPSGICWCGFAHRGQHDHGYQCVAFADAADNPRLLAALAACGCQPGRGEIGIVLVRDFRAALAAKEGAP